MAEVVRYAKRFVGQRARVGSSKLRPEPFNLRRKSEVPYFLATLIYQKKKSNRYTLLLPLATFGVLQQLSVRTTTSI